MIIHNIMEDIVYDKVNKLFDEAKASNESWLTCSCLQCRLDTMCYVLNRVKPRYIKSGKGFAHFLNISSTEKTQVMVDVSALAIEGMRKVLAVQRPHRENEFLTNNDIAFFNFPTIRGKVLNGRNFHNMDGVEVTLYRDSQISPQVDILWDNPYVISIKTPGTFIFCPKSVRSEKLGETKTFRFLLTAQKEGFDSVNVSFEIELTSEKDKKLTVDYSNSYDLNNLFLFSKEEVEEV